MIKGGFLLLDKPSGMSSQTLDYKIKKIFNTKKAGHLGTLDPLATGLIVVGIDDATRFFKYLEESVKKYILRIRIGATSDSLDNEKEISDIVDCDLKGKEEYIDNLLRESIGKSTQIPPIYSAIKVNGEPLYRYALKDKDVEIKARDIEIFDCKRISDIEVKDNQTYFDILLHVSKGFYVRSFAKDFGERLGYPAMADSIRRIEVDNFKIDDAYKLEDLNENSLRNPLDYLNFKEFEIDSKRLKFILNGIKLEKKEIPFNDEYIMLKNNGKNIAIYKLDGDFYRMDLLLER